MSARLRVVDLTDESAVYATRLLADLGADVIRIEPTGADLAEEPRAFRRFFHAGKRSVVIDRTRDEGLDVLARLCSPADAVVEGMAPVAEFERVRDWIREANPALTWVAVRSFAPDAPGRDLKTAEIVRYALSGLMSITGDPQGAPMLVGGGLANAVVAAYATLACYLGSLAAQRSGRGPLVWVSAHEALLAVMQQGLLEAALSGRVVKRAGTRHAYIAMAGALPCRDGHVVISANERTMWQTLVEMVGDARLRDRELDDERVRMQRQEEIFDILAQWVGAFTKDRLAESAQARHVPVAPVNGVGDVLRDPHLRARGFFRPDGDPDDVRGEEQGSMPVLKTPWAGAPASARRPGEDTEAVLREAGFSGREIDDLEARGVIARTAARV